MRKIWDRVYLGSFNDAQQFATANPSGITAVISLCEDAVRRAANISYVHLPIADSCPIPAQKFDAIMQAIADGVRQGNLLVHCIAGSSRSPIMVAGWQHTAVVMRQSTKLSQKSQRCVTSSHLQFCSSPSGMH